MALKFLNKKGWHTGNLRNIENVWKAEQKHEAEHKKLEELHNQIHEEQERSEFPQLQEQAGLIPKQECLDFLYESGLAVGKGTSSFKALESLPKNDPENAAPFSSIANLAAATSQQPVVLGALFLEKPQSSNDIWRKLHSDPLLLIRRRDQEALASVKNNPVQMDMIRKSTSLVAHECLNFTSSSVKIVSSFSTMKIWTSVAVSLISSPSYFLPLASVGNLAQGGKDNASARYIFTQMSHLSRFLFPKADDFLLDYLNEDGQRIEPTWYMSIIPMVLVNGSEGIGTGL